jgi:hypothetical protein
MRNTRPLAALAIAAGALTLAACGSGGGSTGIPSVYDAAHAIGATSVQPYAPGPMASAYAHARWHGHRITIATFATASLEDQWLNLAGIAATVVARGDRYAAVEILGQ